MTAAQDLRISEVVAEQQARLRRFIRSRVPDTGEAEDILQEVFYELVEAYRLMKPVEQAGAWLFRVARNRITDLFRKRKPDTSLNDPLPVEAGAEATTLEELLPSPAAGPDALYARQVLLDELDAALDELPEAQRDVFLATEVEGRSFKELALESGTSVNTLLSRKRYAVQHLRKRLQAIHEDYQTAVRRNRI